MFIGTPRLRMGLAAIVALLGAYGLLDWQERYQAARDDYARMASQRARLNSRQDEQRWPQRAEEALQARDAALGRLWQGNSMGLAQAKVQDWLASLLQQVDAKTPSIKVSEGEVALDASGAGGQWPESLQDIKPVRARVEFASQPQALLALLAALQDAPQQVVVDSLTVKPVKTELTLSFWFVIRPATGPGTAAASAAATAGAQR